MLGSICAAEASTGQLFLKFFIEVQLRYNIISVTGIQPGDSHFLKVILHL